MVLVRAALVLSACVAFQAPKQALRPAGVARRAFLDNDDISIWDTLFRYGPLPTIIRVANPEMYEEKVTELMETTGRSRVDAQRATDFYFNDPNGFGYQEIRERETGERIDYSKKSGVQNRPIFSAFWAAWCFYFFFIFLPNRVSELGGVNPSGFDFGGPGPGGLY